MKNKKSNFKKNSVKNKLDARERIIKVALDIIGEKGNVDPTVREITQKAQVNLASINYYFRSKSKLFSEIEKYYANEVNDITNILNDPNIEAATRILTWAEKLMTQLANYPGIMYLSASRIIKKNNIGKTMRKLINMGDLQLKKLISEVTGINDDKLVALKAIQILSGIINPLIMQYGFGKGFDIDFNDSKIRERHIETLVKSILEI